MQNPAGAAATRLTQSTGLLLCCSCVELLHSVLKLSHWNHRALPVDLFGCRAALTGALPCLLSPGHLGARFSEVLRTAHCWCPAPGLVPAVPVSAPTCSWAGLWGLSTGWVHSPRARCLPVCYVMAMLNLKTQSCSGKLLVKLYILFSMTHSSSMQAVRCWWVILGWKRWWEKVSFLSFSRQGTARGWAFAVCLGSVV